MGANLLVALAPSLILLAWAVLFGSRQIERPREIALALSSGVIAAMAALLAGFPVSALGRTMSGEAAAAYQAFAVAAFTEEAVKAACLGLLFASLRRSRASMTISPREGVLLGTAASVGFAFLESIFYLSGETTTIMFRAFTAVPVHAGCGAIVGFWLARPGRSPLPGVVIAVLLHGAYDYAIFSALIPDPVALVPLGMIVGLVLTLAVRPAHRS